MTRLNGLQWNAQGLLPVITQCHHSKDVLMQAWINEEALKLTIESGFATYWSRSRQALWKKGETSGHIQMIKDIRLDCDADSLLFIVEQVGKKACHTGMRSCFYKTYDSNVHAFIEVE